MSPRTVCRAERWSVAALALLLLGGCYLETEVPDVESDALGWIPGPQAEDRDVGGLTCSGRQCPFTVQGLQQCCTTGDDVTDRRAYAPGRCGFDFSARDAMSTGHCWEAEQPGLPDERCPTVNPRFSGRLESGCCMQTGRCGTLNTVDAVGCHANPGIEKNCVDVDEGVKCDPVGTYAIRNEVDVYWGGRVGGIAELTDDGRGDIVIDLLLRIDNQGSSGLTYDVEVTPCGVRLPPFVTSTLCETYDAQFPDSVWDSGEVPKIYTRASYNCLNPGCLGSIEPAVGLIGIDMDNPEALWPTPEETPTLSCPAGTGAKCFPDADGDGQPAVTLTVRTDGSVPGSGTCGVYNRRAVPLAENPAAVLDPFTGDNVRRGDRLFIGTRTKLGASFALPDDCDSGVVGVGLAEFVQSRAWGCYLKPGSGVLTGAAGPSDVCQASEAAFVDENLPIYQILRDGDVPNPSFDVPQHVSNGPIIRMVKLGPPQMSVSCEEVRSTGFPRD